MNAIKRPIPKAMYDMLAAKREQIKADGAAGGGGPSGGAGTHMVFFQ